jgi:methyl-accepting chemotaxis protein
MEEKQGLFSRVTEWGLFNAIAESIHNKLLVAFLALALIPLIILGVVAYITASNALTDHTFDAVEAVRELKRAEINRLFQVWENDVLDVSSDPGVVAGMTNLATGFKSLGADKVRSLYLGKETLENAGDGSKYSAAHPEQHGFFVGYTAIHGYEDAFLIDMAGNVVYSVHKRGVFGTNLTLGPYQDTNLAELYRELREAAPDQSYLADAALLDEDIATFVGSPIYRGNTQVGILAYRVGLGQVHDIMQESAGMGQSGETYLVGQDKLWRTDSRFLAELGVDSTILNPETIVNTTASWSALAGQTGTQIIDGYRGVKVLSSWAPLIVQEPTSANPEGVRWALISEIDLAEVQQPIVRIALITASLVAGAIILVVGIAFLISGTLVRQINAIMGLFGQIGMGNFEARTEALSRDELGTMAASLNAMLDNTLALIQTREERDAVQTSITKLLDEVSGVAEGDLTAEAEVTADITGAIADSFNFMISQLRDIISGVQEATLQVSSSASEIQTTTEHLAQGSEAQATQIADTAAAVEEMSVSIQQVSENAALSAAVGEQALANARQGARAVLDTIREMNRIRDQVQETAKRLKRLGESSQEIGEIVQLIGGIARRTSILALNASLEAAMAGEAGRGFAVVAEDVKRLSERSTEATKQISTLVRTIQSETNEAVAAMEATTQEVVEGSLLADQAGQALAEIEGVSNRLAELIQSISLASKQQARGSETLAMSMDEIAEVTQQTAAGAKQAAVSISSLAMLADEMRASVSTFKLPDGNGHEPL